MEVALIERILGVLLQVLGIAQGLLGLQTTAARERVPFQIQDTVVSTGLNVANPIYGLAALDATLVSMQGAGGKSLDDVLAAIAATQKTGSAVTLPPTAPPGYGGATAADVWAEQDPETLLAYGALLSYAGTVGFQRIAMLESFVSAREPWFATTQQDPADVTQAPSIGPKFKPSLVTAGQTALQALTAQNPGFTISYLDSDPLSFVQLFDPTDPTETGRTFVLNGIGWAQLMQTLFPSGVAVSDLPPVWPGLAKVALGSSLPLAQGVSVPGPLDGVLVTISFAPPERGAFDFDGLISWRNIGAVTFGSDDGQFELPQTLGFTQAIYVPRTMASAQSAKLRCGVGVTGTVTPWTRTV